MNSYQAFSAQENDVAANLAFFLLDKTGSIFGCWKGKLSDREQYSLFGSAFFGSQTLAINGNNETIRAADFSISWAEAQTIVMDMDVCILSTSKAA